MYYVPQREKSSISMEARTTPGAWFCRTGLGGDSGRGHRRGVGQRQKGSCHIPPMGDKQGKEPQEIASAIDELTILGIELNKLNDGEPYQHQQHRKTAARLPHQKCWLVGVVVLTLSCFMINFSRIARGESCIRAVQLAWTRERTPPPPPLPAESPDVGRSASLGFPHCNLWGVIMGARGLRGRGEVCM